MARVLKEKYVHYTYYPKYLRWGRKDRIKLLYYFCLTCSKRSNSGSKEGLPICKGCDKINSQVYTRQYRLSRRAMLLRLYRSGEPMSLKLKQELVQRINEFYSKVCIKLTKQGYIRYFRNLPKRFKARKVPRHIKNKKMYRRPIVIRKTIKRKIDYAGVIELSSKNGGACIK